MSLMIGKWFVLYIWFLFYSARRTLAQGSSSSLDNILGDQYETGKTNVAGGQPSSTSKYQNTATPSNGQPAAVSASGTVLFNGTTPINTNANGTASNTTVSHDTNDTATTPTASHDAVLPQTGESEMVTHSSMTIFFILSVIAISVIMIHFLLVTNFHYLPESVAVVSLGALIGLVLKLLSSQNLGNWQQEEAFPPTLFFLLFLPPIIFEQGYNLHKGNFFQNIGSILVFAILGTSISALVIGGGIYLLGLADVVYRLSFVESFAFGSLISAVDPVATLAIFHAVNVEPILYMLVFGESMLNDAVSIVLTNTVIESRTPEMAALTATQAVFYGVGRFCLVFFASAAIGALSALISALLLKHVDLRKSPSLEFTIMIVFAYGPYSLAEGLHLSGIMAILFCGIVMSHYTHFNLSPVTQITMQQTFRTLSFIAETIVFAYLGMAIFSFKHIIKPALVIWSIILCLIGRACNIFTLAFILNYFREHRITKKTMFIMWFSGLRGAIAYALVLHLEFDDETRHILVTTTLIIVLFTTLILGGSTMPLIKFMQAEKSTKTRRRRRQQSSREISLSKTKEMGETVDTEHLSEITEEEFDVGFVRPHLKGFIKYDVKYFIPFFTRRFTHQELKDCTSQMTDLTNQWYQAIRVSPSESDEDEETEISTQLITSTSSGAKKIDA